MPPRAARAVRVDLDAEVVRILEVDRLAHEVVGHTGAHTEPRKMLDETTERRAVRKQDRKVVEPQPTTSWHRDRAGPLDELDQRPLVAVRAKRRAVGGSP